MGLLDRLIKGGAPGETDQKAIGGILDMITDSRSGGLEGITGKLAQKQLGGLVESWISTGKNKPVSPSQLNNALGNDMIDGLARKLGVTPATALKMLAKHLPNIIDKLTPDGKMPANTGAVNVQDIIGKLMKR